MNSQVCVLLTCVLFSTAMSLKCHQCLPVPSSECTPEITSCPDQCVTASTAVYMSGTKLSGVNQKSCASSDLCVSGRLNLGLIKVVNNAKCCNTDLCNSETMPDTSTQAANGKKCYTCNSNDCTATLNCEGNEDRCIAATVEQGGTKITMKGCVSKSFCAQAASSSTSGISMTKVSCCEGNLCNGAESFTLNFLLMIAPVISYFLFQ